MLGIGINIYMDMQRKWKRKKYETLGSFFLMSSKFREIFVAQAVGRTNIRTQVVIGGNCSRMAIPASEWCRVVRRMKRSYFFSVEERCFHRHLPFLFFIHGCLSKSFRKQNFKDRLPRCMLHSSFAPPRFFPGPVVCGKVRGLVSNVYPNPHSLDTFYAGNYNYGSVFASKKMTSNFCHMEIQWEFTSQLDYHKQSAWSCTDDFLSC